MVGRWLRLKRLHKDITLQKMADKTGFSKVYLSEIELGKKTPKKENTLKRIAHGYNISIEEIKNRYLFERMMRIYSQSYHIGPTQQSIIYDVLKSNYSINQFRELKKFLKNLKIDKTS